jgi:hypothetical protein
MIEPFQIGTYQLGWRWVDVWVDPELVGGNFEARFGAADIPECPRPKMVIGLARLDLHQIFEVATHEAIEFVACYLGCRMRPTWAYEEYASDCYFFAFDHSKLTEIAARAGNFLCSIHDDLKAALGLIKEARK